MGKKSKENLFKEYLLENLDSTNYHLNRIERTTGEHLPHLRIKHSKIQSISTITDFLDSKNLEYVFDDSYTRSPDYKGNGVTIKWNGFEIGLLLASHKKGGVKRKQYTPDNLHLTGKVYGNPIKFKKDILDSISGDNNFSFLKSLVEQVEDPSKTISIDSLSKADVNRISSDFGEVLCAYKKLLEGCCIEFPIESNYPIADFIVDGFIPYSAKGHNAGKKVNLSSYKNILPSNSNVGLFLKSIASHNRDDFFKYASMLCPAVNEIAQKVGGTTKQKVAEFIQKVDYSEFYSYISTNSIFEGYGVPSGGKGKSPEELWMEGSLDPFYFTVNTLVDRLWGRVYTSEITNIMNKISSNLVFIELKISNNGLNIQEKSFDACEKWETIYWSRATSAFHNWMGIVNK
jgi:hypothetical protein